jgi:nucleoside-diphosphate-sugar epimerase
MKIGVIGASGFVGREIYSSLLAAEGVVSVPITRDNFESAKIRSIEFDLLIHSANPAGRLRANSNPVSDSVSTVGLTTTLMNEFHSSRVLLISTISCRVQPNTPYGQNRLKCEELVLAKGGGVVRLGPMFGGSRTIDTLHDILENRNVFFSGDTEYGYCDVAWNANYIVQKLLNMHELCEIGARNAISLEEIARELGSLSKFGKVNDTQRILDFEIGPDALGVLEYAKRLKLAN